ncbi:hypothetical protein K2173_027092 [Erythroxylum novogranatense]|uniref:ATP synthase CF0 subunit IV n=1 Tax=Erythroxylum novogranatense TaxID=1862640 RepID=A0AAV8U1J4_9ROSI|nr:hypothetical protein K2173_027092 [Erythroxylum novogranatense]
MRFPSPCPSTYHFLGCNCYLIRFSYCRCLESTNHSDCGQNFFKYVFEFIRDISKTQIGEEYGSWVPFIGTIFLFIFVFNWYGVLLPWKIIRLPRLGYFGKYIQPTPILLPINILEDFTKPLSLSFRLFIVVLVSLVPLVVPIPVMFLGLFTSGIQALIFTTLAAAYIGESMEGHH